MVKKTTAILLMALMLFINAVKLFHTHRVVADPIGFSKIISPHHSGDIQSHSSNQNDHCAICDFKLAKDAEISETVIALIPLFHEDVVSVVKLPAYISAFQSTSPGRAPPVLS